MHEPYKLDGRSLAELHMSAACAAHTIVSSPWNRAEKLHFSFAILMGIAKDHGYRDTVTAFKSDILPLLEDNNDLLGQKTQVESNSCI